MSKLLYWLTRIYLSKQAIADCLEYIDKMGFIAVVISGTCDDYSLGKQTQWTTSQITFASAGDAPMKTSLKEGSRHNKATHRMLELGLQCDGAKVITGSTLLGHWVSAHWRNNRLLLTKYTTAKNKLYHQICKSGLIMGLPINHMH